MQRFVLVTLALSILLLTGCSTNNNATKDQDHWVIELHYAQAMNLFENGIYPAAIKQLDKVISLDWSNYLLYLYRGSALYQTKEYEKAMPDFTKAIEMAPTGSDEISLLYYFRGKTKNIIWNYAEAIKDYDNSLSSGLPEEMLEEFYFDRLRLKQVLEDYKWMKDDADILIWINDTNWLYYSSRAQAKAGLDDYKGAIKDANKSIELSPENADMRGLRWYLRMKSGYYSDAIKDLNKSIELGSKNMRNYRVRWLSNAYLKKYTEATKDFKYALELDPGNEDLIQYIKWSEESEYNTRVQNINRHGGNNSDWWWFDAWYEWAADKWIDDPDNCWGNSDSFIEGCINYAETYQEETYQEENW